MIKALRVVLPLLLALVAAACGAPVETVRRPPAGTTGYKTVAYADLPKEARATLTRIAAGGPFPYRRDGSVFLNRERLLPVNPRGYYREFTVATPGRRGRGPRRIVVGEGGERYYSPDHYRTFLRIIG